jgi:hypothetical protein
VMSELRTQSEIISLKWSTDTRFFVCDSITISPDRHIRTLKFLFFYEDDFLHLFLRWEDHIGLRLQCVICSVMVFKTYLICLNNFKTILCVCELMGWVRNVVLIKCIFGFGKPKGGRDFGWEGTWAR